MRVFGLLITFLLVALVLAAMMLTGMLPTLFGDEFSKKIDYASVGDTPCPTVDARPVSAEGIQLQILNASSTSGLAGRIADKFESMGYEIVLIDNSLTPFRGSIQFDVGPGSVDAAYTMARYFHEPVRIKLRELPTGTVNVTLGEGFQGFHSNADLEEIQASMGRLRPLPECLPVDPDSIPQSGGAQSGQSGE